MPNFLEETLNNLAKNNKTIQDVKWVGFTHEKGNVELVLQEGWPEFNFEYDDDYGHAEIPLSLVIVGDNWWMERGEYDGSEWWEFKTVLDKPIYRLTPKMNILELK